MIPPLIGFFGKQSVLLSAIGSGYYFMSIVAIIVSVISASYYLRIIKELQLTNDTPLINNINLDSLSSKIQTKLRAKSDHLTAMHLEPSSAQSAEEVALLTNLNKESRLESNTSLRLTNLHAFVISLLTLTMLLFVLKPSILLNSVTLCTLNYFYL